MPVPTAWHPGELAAQEARGFEDGAWGGWQGYQPGAPDWMIQFLHQLPFLSLTTLDEKGRPWSSIVCHDGREGFIRQSKRQGCIQIIARAGSGEPLWECLTRLHRRFDSGEKACNEQGEALDIAFQIAAVGVMFHNRRRNKMEGIIVNIDRLPSKADDSFVFDVFVSNTFGNCPKYINARLFNPVVVNRQEIIQSSDGKDLPNEALSLIESADLLFLASRYSGDTAFEDDPARLGNNHRGGPPGFLRTYWDEEKNARCILLPDWSGNRLMMSFGNITKDPVAGIAIPIWSQKGNQPSDVIQATCQAKILAGEEASSMMRGIKGAVQLWIQDWIWNRQGIPLVDASGGKESIGWSAYNPPVRLLKREETYLSNDSIASLPNAVMIDAIFWSDVLATFTFEIKEAARLLQSFLPGKHIVIDCSDLLDSRFQSYSHMAQFRGGEKDLNDDGTRSWTISDARITGDASWQFDLTLRRKERGGVTPTLFRQGMMLREALDDGMELPSSWRPKMNVLGIDGTTTLPERRTTTEALNLVYLVSGIGVTPLLAHLNAIVKDQSMQANVIAILATRPDEVQSMQRIIHSSLQGEKKSDSGNSIRLQLKLILIVSKVVDGEAMPVVEQDLWNSLPSKVDTKVEIVIGQRLSPHSLDSDISDGIPLDDSSRTLLSRADLAVICAAPAFSRIARQALQNVNLSEEVIHVESFAF